jgi:lysophospholipase L1-like esterase
MPNAANAALYIRTGAGTVRAATANDLLLLTAQQVIGTVNSSSPLPVGVGYSATMANPLPSQYVLDADEVQAAVTRTDELNAVIRAEATSRNLALFDSNTFFARVAVSGIATNAVDNQVAFIRGNLFSLDGVHPTSRGYAIIANEMITAINAKYGSTLRQVDANLYPGVAFPQ